MSLEELMNIQVISVTKQPEKFSAVASAIQVITQEDIQRSGATNIPEALRLATNLQVAQFRSNAWIISARGFNAPFSNKLLVMVDGRTVYSPLFAGVFWDAQSVLLEDVDRIEVISGPGGTVWGANAVNGIINIITKSSKDTKGLYVSAAAGDLLKDFGAARYSGTAGTHFSYRVFAQRSDYNNTTIANGTSNNDDWHLMQGGFRMDWSPSSQKDFMLEGNWYGGKQKTSPAISPMNGQNLLGRYTHHYSEKSELEIQVYVDRTWRRDVPSTITDKLETYDFDLQHRFSPDKHNTVVWGLGYRFQHNNISNGSVFAGFLPTQKDLNLYSGFIQDEIVLFNSKMKFTIGTKLENYSFSGFSFQPSGRIAWTPNEQNTIWAACSRAVRAPSRIDVDYYIPTYPVPPGSLNIHGGPDFKSEKLAAYELGYRAQPTDKLFLSIATFYNRYNDLYSVEPLPGTLTYETMNGVQGFSNGLELSGTYQLLKKWRLKGGYTYFFKRLENKPGHVSDFSTLGDDPKNEFLIQSIADLPAHLQFDVVARYVSTRPNPSAPDYFTCNAHLAWAGKKFEIAVTGQNLWRNKHTEYSTAEIPRNFYCKVTCHL